MPKQVILAGNRSKRKKYSIQIRLVQHGRNDWLFLIILTTTGEHHQEYLCSLLAYTNVLSY